MNILIDYLKVLSCKLCNSEDMINLYVLIYASTQITNTGFFAFIAVLVFKLLGR